MDMVENLAISAPLFAKTLALNAICKIDPEREEKYRALGIVLPLVSNSLFEREREREVLILTLTLCSFLTRSGMRGGGMRFLLGRKNCLCRLIRWGRGGLGMRFF